MDEMSTTTKRPGIVGRTLDRLWHSQAGSLLLETTMVLSVFTLVGLTVLAAIQTSFNSKRSFDEQSTVENLIRNQMESVFEQTYVGPGSQYVATQAINGYTTTADTLTYDVSSTDIATVRVTVKDPQGNTVKVFEMLRSNR